MISTGRAHSNAGGTGSRVPATVVSSAVALCELPSSHSHEAGVLMDATLTVCGSHGCDGTVASASARSGGAHFVVGAEMPVVVGVSPPGGSSSGGSAVRVRHLGPVLDGPASRQHAACRVGTTGPISASSTHNGDAVELECMSPAHAPGVVSVAVGRGTGRAEDVRSTFTFMQDAAADAAAEDDADWPQVTSDVRVSNVSVSSTTTCDDIPVPSGDVVAMTPSWGPAEGGTEIALTVGVAVAVNGTMSRPVGACGMQRASCRVGTVWVSGYLTPQGVSCATPAHAPGTAPVAAPKMASGLGQPFEYRSAGVALPPGEEAALDGSAVSNRHHVVHVASSSRSSARGAYVDVTAAAPMKETAACVFASPAPARASVPWMFTAAAHVISGVVARCETPASIQTVGVSVVDRSQVDSLVSVALSFSAHHEAGRLLKTSTRLTLDKLNLLLLLRVSV